MNAKLGNCQDWPALARQANWSVTGLAKLCGVSGSAIRRHFLSHEGRAPKDWLAEQRLRQAIELLRESSSIKETALLLGYKQQSNFTRKFKEFWGTCPSVFLSAHQQGNSAPKRAKRINNG